MLSAAFAVVLISHSFGPPPSQAEACKAAGITQTAGQPARPDPRFLGTLPDAKEYHLVMRKVGDCEVADVVRYDPATGQSYVVREAMSADGLKLDRNIPNGRIIPNGFGRPTPVQPPAP